MLERDFKIAALARNKRRRLRRKYGAGFAQNDLAKLIGKFNGDLDVGERQVPRIHKATRKSGDLLIQKVFGAAEGQVFNLKFRRVGLLGGPEGKM